MACSSISLNRFITHAGNRREICHGHQPLNPMAVSRRSGPQGQPCWHTGGPVGEIPEEIPVSAAPLTSRNPKPPFPPTSLAS